MDNARQQIVDSIKKSNNILVAVSTDPSVDELSAALGLSVILNNMDKRATAIFSGAVPPAIDFLEPGKTFESNADSLRDFIIALNKEKADHLRYKVDGDVVKIFITPYKTTLSKDDLEFSMGDYNVDLVLGLGVKDQGHLDKALEAHGKILHDATVVTVTAGADGSSLGNVDWHDGAASSLSEMIVGLADGLKGTGPIFDEQIATALLTGIVSATDRFSNDHTTSRSMTMAAQLMAAGANQQLIAAKLEEAQDITPPSTTKLSESKPESEQHGSELTIDRSGGASKDKPSEPVKDEKPASDDSAQKELEQELAGITGAPTGTLEDIEKELKEATDEIAETAKDDKGSDQASGLLPPLPEPVETPVATSEPVSEPAPVTPPAEPILSPAAPIAPEEPPIENSLPQIVNEHGTRGPGSSADTSPINSIQESPHEDEPPTVDPFSTPVDQQEAPALTPSANIGTPEGAALLASEPELVAPVPAPQIEPLAPPLPAPQPPAPVAAPMSVPELPPLPPLPSDLNLPPLPPPPPPPPTFGQAPLSAPSGAVSGDVFGDGTGTAATPPAPVTPPEPGQFKIPGSS